MHRGIYRAEERSNHITMLVDGDECDRFWCFEPRSVVGAQESRPVARQELHVQELTVERCDAFDVASVKRPDPSSAGHRRRRREPDMVVGNVIGAVTSLWRLLYDAN